MNPASDMTSVAAAPESRFSEYLRRKAGPSWLAATEHPFTVAIGDGTIDPGRYSRYLVEDRHFVDSFTSVIGFTLAKAPALPTRRRLAQFIAGALNEDNNYFERSFAELGIDPQAAMASPPGPVTQEISTLMLVGARDGAYEEGLVAILAAEWIYLTWAVREAAKARPKQPYLAAWIDLHAIPEFQEFVGWLIAETDRAGSGLGDERRTQLAGRFRRCCELEAAFFEQAWSAY